MWTSCRPGVLLLPVASGHHAGHGSQEELPSLKAAWVLEMLSFGITEQKEAERLQQV